MSFYAKVLRRLVEERKLDASASTLVVAGGAVDRDAMLAAGFTDVTISNLDVRMTGDEFEPYRWSFQDAEALHYADGAFAQVIEHAGLHHCASPHRALTEMYRVAAASVLVFEARDSVLMRFGKVVGLTSDHEVEAVVATDYTFGGWRNTALPNYVYRWTEREVEKAIASYDPSGRVRIKFFYGLQLPTERLAMGSNIKRFAAAALALPIKAIFVLARKQGNKFAFLVEKPVFLHPWNNADRTPNRLWLEKRYKRLV